MTAPVIPQTFGATRLPDGGARFTLFSRHATRVWLLLFDPPGSPEPSREVELEASRHRRGDVWQITMPDVAPGTEYLYRVDGNGPQGAFDPGQWLLDPCARAVAAEYAWAERDDLEPAQSWQGTTAFPRGVVIDDDFDWEDDAPPRTPLRDTVVYEAHVRGLTRHPSSGVNAPGTWGGLAEKADYLRDLGVTAVELLPAMEFHEAEYFLRPGDARAHLRNYWGYGTLAFFAPHGRFRAGEAPADSVREFKAMVKALHRAGLEVILDVVFNHTGECRRDDPTFCFRGIDNQIYYLHDPRTGHYRDFSGCGNCLSVHHPAVLQFVLDCLRYWVAEMRVDGFRFDLATALVRDANGHFLPEPPLIRAIEDDPVLRSAKLIAEPWDAVGGYQVGSFPGQRWAEWNGKFRDRVRGFWRGDPHTLGPFTTALTGSSPLYGGCPMGPLKSLNFVTSHDGFTLADLVSYSHKRNEANAEEGRDGDNHNLSWNCGHEGPTDDPAVLDLRLRQRKNLLASLFLAQGVPMLSMGDEIGRSQQGNNNAYNQDNETSWLDWAGLDRDADLHAAVRKLAALRRAHAGLRRRRFFSGKPRGEHGQDIEWFGVDGHPVDWSGGHAMACRISGLAVHTGHDRDLPDLFLAFNGGEHETRFPLPPSRNGADWTDYLSTHPDAPPLEDAAPITVPPASLRILLDGPLDEGEDEGEGGNLKTET